MTQDRFRFAQAAGMALTLVLSAAVPAAAGPFNGPGAVATPTVPNGNFVQLKQISGFTGTLAFGYSDGAYAPVGTSFNKLAKFRLSVNCPAGYHVHQAGVRLRGADVHNFDLELVSPGALGSGQSSWQQVYDNEPWDFDAVLAAGIAALDAAGNNGPVYVSLDTMLDSRTEFYGWCVSNDAPPNQTAIYYDSAEDNGDLRPMTRVRYTLAHGIVKQPGGTAALAPAAGAQAAGISERLRHRDRAVPAAAILKAPGGCPYDCPPPAPHRQRPAN